MNTNKKMNRNPKLAHYVSNAGQLNLTRLVDDAVEVLEDIRYNGVGRQRDRSRGRYLGKIERLLMAHGYTMIEARCRVINEQIIAIFELKINADE